MLIVIRVTSIVLLSLCSATAWANSVKPVNEVGGRLQETHVRPSQHEVAEGKLFHAIWSHDLKAAQGILDAGLNPDYIFAESDTSPLVEAIAERQPKIIALLLTHGASVNFGEETGLVPLAVAAWYDDADTVSELLKRGAKVDALDEDGYTPLLQAASHAEGVGVVKLLLASGADAKKTGAKDGATALMLAASRVNVEAVRFFLKFGLDPCARDNEGMTASGYVNSLVNPSGGKEIRRILDAPCK